MWYHKHCVSVTYYNLLSTLQLYCQPFWLLSWHAPRAPPSHRSLSIYCTWLLYYLVGPFLSSLGSFSNAFLNTDCYARLWRNSGKQIIQKKYWLLAWLLIPNLPIYDTHFTSLITFLPIHWYLLSIKNENSSMKNFQLKHCKYFLQWLIRVR